MQFEIYFPYSNSSLGKPSDDLHSFVESEHEKLLNIIVPFIPFLVSFFSQPWSHKKIWLSKWIPLRPIKPFPKRGILVPFKQPRKIKMPKWLFLAKLCHFCSGTCSIIRICVNQALIIDSDTLIHARTQVNLFRFKLGQFYTTAATATDAVCTIFGCGGGGTVAVMYCSSDSGSNVMIWNICTHYRLFVWSEVTAGLNPCSGQIETRFGPRDCVTAPNWSDCRKWNRWHTAHMIHLMLLNVLSCTRIWGYLITSNSENFTPFCPPIL